MTKAKDENMTQQLGDYITTAEAAKILGRSARRVTQLVQAGELEAVKLNPRLTMVKRDSVYAYLARQ